MAELLIDDPMTWQGSDEYIIGAGMLSREVQEPDWYKANYPENWEAHVGPNTIKIWDTLKPYQRAAIACDAAWRARNAKDVREAVG